MAPYNVSSETWAVLTYVFCRLFVVQVVLLPDIRNGEYAIGHVGQWQHHAYDAYDNRCWPLHCLVNDERVQEFVIRQDPADLKEEP